MAFDPGPEWRRGNVGDWPSLKGKFIVMWDNEQPQEVWHYKAPVSPLPTEPYTVIRVTWQDQEAQQRKSGHVFTLFEDGLWGIASPEQIRERITGFEVLAVPVQTAEVRAFDLVREERADLARQFEEVRRETAKAIVSFIGSIRAGTTWSEIRDNVAREFGVES